MITQAGGTEASERASLRHGTDIARDGSEGRPRSGAAMWRRPRQKHSTQTKQPECAVKAEANKYWMHAHAQKKSEQKKVKECRTA